MSEQQQMTTDANVWAIVEKFRNSENGDIAAIAKNMGDGSTIEESFMFGFRKKLTPKQLKRLDKIINDQEKAEGMGGWSGSYFGWCMRWVQHILETGATQ